MIAARVTQSYADLFHLSNHSGELRHATILQIGAYEIRFREIESISSSEEASLWVELYDLDLRLSVDSCKSDDLEAAIDAAHVLIMKAKLLNNNEAGQPTPFACQSYLHENL